MKRQNAWIAALLALACLFGCRVDAATEQAWYIRRAGHNRPSIDIAEEKLCDLGACWIDNVHTDDCTEKVLYLTFDAGYINESVISILDTLQKEQVPGAFFILANPILKNEEAVRRMSEEGHTVCNHTKNHKSIAKMTTEEIRKNLTDLERLYSERIGTSMAPYFRPPEGTYTEEALRTVHELGYTTVFWSFAYADWDEGKQPSPKQAMKKILDNTHNGAVILLHPTSATNARILPELIAAWRQMGYRFGTMDELVKAALPT